MNKLVKTLLICSFLFVCQVSTKTEKLKLDSQRKYQNVLIHINDNVEENAGTLLNLIKEQVSLASKALYTATNNMDKLEHGVKFGTVYINIPNHWHMSAPPSTWQNSENANFQILTKDDNGGSDKPFTFQLKQCGKAGKYSRFSDRFFLNGSDASRNGKEIMREFVKLRFGVFSEEPYRNILFVHNGTHFVNSSCNHQIEWEVNNSPEICSDKNSICKYKIKANQIHTSSVMFDTETPSSQFFCNDGDRPHNSLAYNRQNKYCKRQSITKVILQHSDFRQKSRGVNEYEPPTFEIVKQPGRKIVFVLDTSGSMHNAISSVKSAVQIFINTTVEPSAEIGIVTFKNTAKPLSSLVGMDNAEERKRLFAKINSISSFGFSNIVGGLVEAVKIFTKQQEKNRTEFESIILITDGIGFTGETFKDKKSLKTILTSRVAVNLIFIGKASNKGLIRLSKLTGGKYYDTNGKKSIADILEKLKFKGYQKGKLKYSIKKYDGEKYGKKDGKKYGKKDGNKYGNKYGKKYGKKDGNKYGNKYGKKDGKKDGNKYGNKYGKKDGKKYGKKDGNKYGNKYGKKDGNKYGKKYGKKDGNKYGNKYGKKDGKSTYNKKKGYGKYGKKEKIEIVSEFQWSNFTYFAEINENETIIRVEFVKNVSKYDAQLLDHDEVSFRPETIHVTENGTKIIFRIPGEEIETYRLVLSPRPGKREKRSIENIDVIKNKNAAIFNSKAEIFPTEIEMVDESTVVTSSIDLSNSGLIEFKDINVKILIFHPGKGKIIKTMSDDGIGDDSIEGDGIFTRKLYFKDINSKGSYKLVGLIRFKDIATSRIITWQIQFNKLLVKGVSQSVDSGLDMDVINDEE